MEKIEALSEYPQLQKKSNSLHRGRLILFSVKVFAMRSFCPQGLGSMR
jgi:hypothetical protein